VDLRLIDPSKSIESQGPFELVFHKLTDELANEGTNASMRHIVQSFEVYFAAHPEVIDIDPIAVQRKALDRLEIANVLSKVEANLPKGIELRKRLTKK
jgi:hypothetical protein